MPMRKGIVPIDELRRLISARLAGVSLRGLARDVGMSPTGLQKFVDGSVPYLPTRQKLERWLVREVAEGRAEMSPGAALAALEVLVHDLPADRQEPARKALVRVLRAAYGAASPPHPAWLEELARRLGPGAEG